MKKNLLFLLVTIMFTNCTETASDEKENADPLLSGITFYNEASDWYGFVDHNGIIDLNEGQKKEGISLAWYLGFADLKYSIDTVDVSTKKIKINMYADTLSTLVFENETCKLKMCRLDKIQTVYQKNKDVIYTFEDILTKDKDGADVKVDKNGIYGDGSYVVIMRSGRLDWLFELDNYKIKAKRIEKTYGEMSEATEVVLIDETYDYSRMENEVIFTNTNSKLYGKLNTTDMTLELTQLAPLKKNLGTFKLKEK